MNQNQQQQASDGRHDDDAALSDFLASLMDYTPTIPDELVEHYLAKSGFQCPDVRLGNRKIWSLEGLREFDEVLSYLLITLSRSSSVVTEIRESRSSLGSWYLRVNGRSFRRVFDSREWRSESEDWRSMTTIRVLPPT